MSDLLSLSNKQRLKFWKCSLSVLCVKHAEPITMPLPNETIKRIKRLNQKFESNQLIQLKESEGNSYWFGSSDSVVLESVRIRRRSHAISLIISTRHNWMAPNRSSLELLWGIRSEIRLESRSKWRSLIESRWIWKSSDSHRSDSHLT